MNEQLKHYEDKLRYEIDSWDLNESVKNGESVIIVDTRSKEAYKFEHIKGAINLPHKDMTEERIKEFGQEYLYVTYCDGIGCNASTKGARNLLKLGFQVKELMGGIEWWKRDGHSTEGTNASPGSDSNCGCG